MGKSKIVIWLAILQAVISALWGTDIPSADKYLIFFVFLCATYAQFPALPAMSWGGFQYLRRHAYPLLAFMLMIYVFELVFYKNQIHRFDPFLQAYVPDIHVPKAKADGELRIICLGGSTTACRMLPDTARYPYLLEKKLRQRFPDKRIRVINLGSDWFSTKHLLICYVTVARYYHPDIVICMESINDVYRSFSPMEYALGDYNDEYTHFYGPAGYAAAPPTAERTFILHSVFRSFYDMVNRSKEHRYDISAFRSIVPFIRNLHTLSDYTRADSVALIMVTQPHSYTSITADPALVDKYWMNKSFCTRRAGRFLTEYADIPSMAMAMDSFRRSEIGMAQELAVPLIDASPLLPASHIFFTDDVHYTSRGSDSLSTIVASFVGDRVSSGSF